VRGLLQKSGAEILTFDRWDERHLAYPIKGRSRGVYLLVRFTAPTDHIRTIERDCQLSDAILRVLVTRDLESEKLAKAGLFEAAMEERRKQAERARAEAQAPAAPAAEGPPRAAARDDAEDAAPPSDLSPDENA